MFTLKYPLAKQIITSRFGWRLQPKIGWHSGLDLACPVGTAIHAAHKGKLIFAGLRGNYGLTVILLHEGIGRVWTLYAHLSHIARKLRENVTEGEIIAFGGNTGWSLGPHLHFEVRNGFQGILAAKDPLNYLVGEKV